MLRNVVCASIEVEDYLYATSQLSQTTLRSILGQSDLDDLLSRRDEINRQLQQVIDQQTEPWGVKVANVEVKNVDLPQEMQRALAKQAEAERERRAKVINAQGEFEAAQKLSEAADQIGAHPPALQLRFLLVDDLLSRRDEINRQLQQVIDQQTEPWGVKVANVEVKNVDLPQEMQRALAKQALSAFPLCHIAIITNNIKKHPGAK